MKSRITIEVDFDNFNQPVINLLKRDSDDVRDKLVHNLIERLAHTSRWCRMEFIHDTVDDGEWGQKWKIVPIQPSELIEEIKLMQAVIKTK